MKNLIRILICSLLVLTIVNSGYSQDVYKTASMGIGTVSPAQKLEISGSTNTVRIDGLVASASYWLTPSLTADNFIYVNNATGDIYGMASGASGSVMAIGATGIPTWSTSSSVFGNAWFLTGNNISLTYGTNFIGTTNNYQLQFRGVGYGSGTNSTIGLLDQVNNNVYFGGYSTASTGNVSATAIVAGALNNVAIGDGSMGAAASGTSNNVFMGYQAGLDYHAASSVGVGAYALKTTTTGAPNTAMGYYALGISSATGANNIGFGYESGYEHTTGSKNVGLGAYTFGQTTFTGSNNTATGYHASYETSTGSDNSSIGYQTQYFNTTGTYNTSMGWEVLYDNAAGGRNTIMGSRSCQLEPILGGQTIIGSYAGYELYENSPITDYPGPNVLIGDSIIISGLYASKAVSIGYMSMKSTTYGPSEYLYDVAIGFGSQEASSQSSYDVTVGSQAWMKGATTSTYDVVLGAGAAEGSGFGGENIVIGTAAMGSSSASSSGSYSVAIGSSNSIVSTPLTVLSVAYGGTLANASAYYTVGIGSGAGYNATALYYTTLIGSNAGFNLTSTPEYNTYIGFNAAYTATTGYYNTVIGANAGYGYTTGYYNTVIGGNTYVGAVGTNYGNTVIGEGANAAYGSVSTAANEYNEAIGYNATAGVGTGTANNYEYYNLAIGANANASPPASSGAATTNAGVAIGYNAQALAANSVAIGANAYATQTNSAVLGSINGVNGATSNVSVGINTPTPHQELEVSAGTATSGTIRIDGLNSSGSTYYTKLTTTSNVLYSLNSTGDIYALPNGTTNQQLILGAGGVPTWGIPPFTMTTSSPLSGAGTVASPFALIGTTGGVLEGQGILDSISYFNNAAPAPSGSTAYVLTMVTQNYHPENDSIAWVSTNAAAGIADNWGLQVAETDSSSLIAHTTISGNGTSAYPLRLDEQGASNGQTLAFNTTLDTWKPSTFYAALGAHNIVQATGSAVTVANGTGQVVGSGNVTLDLQGTAGGILTGNGLGSSATFTAVGTAGQALTVNGSGVPTWQALTVPAQWALTGNTGITPGTNFIGTLDDKQFRIFLTGVSSTYTGNSGSIDPQLVSGTAFANTYLGAVIATTNHGAGYNDQGSYNTGIGFASMAYASSTATYNVALGAYSLEASGSTMSSSYNVAVGYRSMVSNDNGGSNETGIGYQTLGGISNTLSNSNTAIGYQSMYGQAANATYYGSFDAANGYNSLYAATSGGNSSNTAMGSNSAYSSIASTNSAVGDSSLYTNSSGTQNTALGYAANDSLSNYTNTTLIGANSESKQSNTLVLGSIANNNKATSSTNVGIGTNLPASDAGLAIKNNHFESQGSLAAGNVFTDPAAGTGGGVTATITNSNDIGGTISFEAGSTVPSGGGEVVTAYFGYPYTYAPIVVFTPANAAAADAMTTDGAYVSSGTGSFSISFNTAPTAGQTYAWNYFIIETPGTLAGAEPCYVPVTINNTASSATPTNFQQMITVNSSLFSSYETAGLTNVEFSTGTSGGGTVLNAWLEGANASPFNTSTSTVYWVNLAGNTIPAGGSLTIYMDFLSSTTMTGTGGVMGEAPQLSGTYGQYDNGPSVFSFYDNFAGTTLSATNWNSYTNGGTITVNNGLTITSGGSNPNAAVISTNASFTTLVGEVDASGSGPVSGSRSYMPGLITTSATSEGVEIADQNSSLNCMAYSNGMNGYVNYAYIQGNASTNFEGTLGTPSAYNIVSLDFSNGGTDYWYLDYSSITSSASDEPSAPVYLAIGAANYGGSSTLSAYWARARQFPPSATMPAATVGGSVTCTGTGAQPAEPNPCDIPFTLINNQSTATPVGFQQLIQVNSSLYASDGEAANLDNVEFTTGPEGTGTQIPSWLESGNSSSSTKTTYWLNLGSLTIPAGGSLTIYMDFASSNILSAGGPAGEAPQLSGTYAQYDNGASIFPYYVNFAGTSLPSSLFEYTQGGGGSYTVNNGLTLSGTSQNEDEIYSNASYNYNTVIMEACGYDGSGLGSDANDRFLVWNNDNTGVSNGIYLDGGYYLNGDGCNSLTSIIGSGVSGNNIWSIWGYGTTSYGAYNYTTIASSADGCSSSPYYIQLGDGSGGTYYQYLRLRTTPPNNVMPAAVAGELSCCQPTAAPGAISGPTGTFCPGTTATYSISSVAGATSYTWSVPAGTVINSGQGTTSINVTYGSTSGVISVVTINSCGAASSPTSTSTLTTSFSITAQPANASTSCATGSVATFTVSATGTDTYQWQVSTDGGSTWTNLSNGGTYSNVTTSILTITTPTFTQNLYEYRCIVTGSCGGSATSSAATLNVYGNIPITITNSQSTATGTNFPQMINVTSSSYTAQEMSGLQNVEFTVGGPAGTGTALQSWLESGNSNTASNTVYWVNLGSNSIAAGGSLTIYMNFMSTSVLSASGPAGEAPQLSGVGVNYALYDNGALVFPSFYDNFVGTSLASQWTSSGGANIAVSNGLTLTNNGNNWFGPYTNTFTSALGNVAESYCSATSVGTSGTGLDICTGISSSSTGMDAQMDANIGYGSGGSVQSAPTANQNFYGSNIVSASTYYVFSVSVSNSPGPVEQVNYGAIGSLTGNSSTAVTPANSPVGLGVSGANGSFQWFRIRPNAPNSTMPSASLGTLTCCTTPPTVGSISGSPTSFCPGATGSYSITAVAGASSYVWTVPTGAIITSGQGTTSINVTFGSSGGNVSVAAQNVCGLDGTPTNFAVTSTFSITGQPANATVSCAGSGTATFTVTASGTNTYQWQVNSGSGWSNVTNAGVYSGATSAILTITSPPFSMNGYEYQCIVTNTSPCGGSPQTSSAATLNVYGNVPITLTNSTSTATSSGFQQMLTVISSNYTAQEMSGLQNVEFTIGGPAGTGSTLNSWIESGNSNTSSATIYWVNLGTNTISAGGTLTIYMNFMTSNVMSTAGPAGEAPDISPTYAQYDDGGLVFPNVYTRWGGNSGGVLPTTTGTGAINGGAITSLSESCGPSTALTITNSTNYTQVAILNNNNCSNGATTTDVNGVYYSTTPASAYTYPTVVESKVLIDGTYHWFGTGFGQEEQGEGAIVANDQGGGSYFSVRSDFNYQGAGNYCATNPSTYDNIDNNTSLVAPATSPYVWSILLNWNGTNDQITSIMGNYTQVTGTTFPANIDGQGANNDQTGCTLTTKFGVFGTAQNTGLNYDDIYWTRTRIFPPAGVMPSATYYSSVCCSTPTAPGSITCSLGSSPLSYCPGASATFSISAVAGASSYVWSVPAGSTFTGQGTTSISVTLGANSGTVSVYTTNSCGEQSSSSNFTVTSLTAFITQPSNDNISCGGAGSTNATFTVNVSGATAWQWQDSSSSTGGLWVNLTNTAPYSNVTTATMTVTTPSTAYNGIKYRCLVTTSSCGSATSNEATLTVSSLNSVPITLTNAQTSATAAGLQVMLNINFSTYSAASPAVASNLNNVYFSTGPSGTGTPLYAWIENSSTTTPATAPSNTSSAIIWVNLGALTISGGSGTQIIYMTFEPSAVMTSTTSYTGEAPELTGTYGQYDNGAYVFGANAYVPGVYDGFQGTTLSSSIWNSYISGSGTTTVSNGLTITGSTGGTQVNVISSNTSVGSSIGESYVSGNAPQSGSRSYMPGLISNTATVEGTDMADDNEPNCPTTSYVCFSNGRAASVEFSWLQGWNCYVGSNNGADYNVFQPTSSSIGYTVWSIVYSNSTSINNSILENYTLQANGTQVYNPTGNMHLALGIADYGEPTSTSLSAYWARTREYPPSATLPAQSIGSYGCH